MSHTYETGQGDTSTDNLSDEVPRTLQVQSAPLSEPTVDTLSDRLNILEAEIAFQRKVNSSWQTPIPESPGEQA